MMTIIDILIYVAFAFFASSLAKKSENYIEENDISPMQWDRYLTYFVLFFTVIGGIRWNVGSDNISYAAIFAYREVDFETNEKLWAYFVYLIQYLGLHWTVGLALCMFIQIYFVTKTLQPYRWLLIFVPFVFFGSFHWLNWTGAVRQMIVGCVFFWASRFIYKKEIIKYFIFVFVCVFIHQSSIILLPLVLLPSNIELTNKRNLLLIIFGLCVFMGQMTAFAGLAGYVQTIASIAEYDAYGEAMYEMLTTNYNSEALKVGPMMMTYILIPVFIIWFGQELKDNYSDKIPYFDLWFNFSYIYACFFFLVCNLGHIFIRPVLYFSVFQLVMASILLYYLCLEYKNFGYRQITTYLFCFIIALNTMWDVYKASNSGNPLEFTTYKVFFLHSDQRKFFNL